MRRRCGRHDGASAAVCPAALLGRLLGNCLRRISAAEIFWKRSPCSFVRTKKPHLVSAGVICRRRDRSSQQPEARSMLEQYKKRFWGMQAFIALIVIAV